MLHMGELIQERRIEKRMVQSELASKAYVTVGYIKALERGNGAISFDKIARFTNVLDLDIRELAEFYT